MTGGVDLILLYTSVLSSQNPRDCRRERLRKKELKRQQVSEYKMELV
jgi:hypothetical protein